ncbi:dienelactone hydrolase family protein [Phenylobacterium sp.]|uniref:dienelactone hydrolase family protein n=1 Tax=Phenylobacterium sp. TaxID=1871053 RepID=UPI00121A95AA|nr:dienelactone hydrolase family protein [Phenylobacterium sp.]THD60571.1 MAG: dienelactone hydrolase family protein [Phenylobacterium sp.]
MSDTLIIHTADGDFSAYVARPTSKTAPVVIVLHEVFGVNADIKQTCEELAAKGFLAIAPDLFWRQEPGVSLSMWSDAEWQKGVALYTAYDRDQGVKDIQAAIEAARLMPGSSGKVAIQGFCLGALMGFLTSARGQVDAVVAYHGGDTEKYLDEAPAIKAPMLMHLAEEDEFISKPAQAAIKAALAGKSNVEVFSYPGCNHAFARHTGLHYDAKAAALANGRTWAFLADRLALAKATSSDAQAAVV